MELALLDIAPQNSEVAVRMAPPEYEIVLGADHVRSRTEIVRHALAIRREGGGLGAYIGNADQDAATGRAEIAWRILRSWDAEHILTPLLTVLSEREMLVVHPGASALEHFSFRASLREMIRSSIVESDVLQRLPSLPLWHVRAFDKLLGASGPNVLPLVDPARTVVLLAPPAAEGGFLQRLARLPRAVARRVLEQSPAQLQQIQRLHTLETLLREFAHDAGMQLVVPVSRADLLEYLAPVRPGQSLILVAHQDEYGVHLQDGPLDMGTIRAAFSERIKSGAYSYDNVLLAVCLAEESGNLASCFQATGCPVVISHGYITYYGRVLAMLACAFEILLQRGPHSLPSLVDEAWLHLTRSTSTVAKAES